MSTVGSAFEGFRNVKLYDGSSRNNHKRIMISAALIAADILAFLMASLVFRVNGAVPRVLLLAAPTDTSHPVDLFNILAAGFVAIRYISGDYTRRSLFWDRARATTVTLLLLASPCFLIVALFPGQYSLVAETASWVFMLFAIPIFRQCTRMVLDQLGLWRIPTAFITNIAHHQDALNTISHTLTLGCRIDWLAVNSSYEGQIACSSSQQKIVYDNTKSLATMLISQGCDHAVIAANDLQGGDFSELTQDLMDYGIAVSIVPNFRRLPLVGATTSYFFGKDFLLFQMRGKLQSLPSRFVKRTFDLVVSALALIFLAPFFLIFAFLIKRDDGGPVFYAQNRTGRNGEQFKCLKFRSMATDATERLERWKTENPELYEEFQKTFKLVNDPRITPLGGWLRKTSLDELPQLVNVFLGEMSLVGPRPVLERELIEFYGPVANLYKRVRPGLTGLWQVRGRSDTSYEQRVFFDEWYVLNWSFWYDIVILLETVWVVILRKGAY